MWPRFLTNLFFLWIIVHFVVLLEIRKYFYKNCDASIFQIKSNITVQTNFYIRYLSLGVIKCFKYSLAKYSTWIYNQIIFFSVLSDLFKNNKFLSFAKCLLSPLMNSFVDTLYKSFEFCLFISFRKYLSVYRILHALQSFFVFFSSFIPYIS